MNREMFGTSISKFYINGFSLACLKRIGWLALIAGLVFLFSNQDIVTYSHINLSLQTAKPELIQVFCDQGYGFKEELSNSVKNINKATEYEHIKLKLPSSCKRLRLDLGDIGAVIKIISASLITSGGYQVDILSEITSPASLNGIKASNSNPAKFIATTNDPFLVLSGDYSIATATGYSGMALLKMMGIFLIVIGSMASISYVSRKYNIKLNTFLVSGHIPLFIIVITGAFFRIFYWFGSPLPSEPNHLFKMWPDEGTYFSIAQYIMTHGLRDYFFAEQSVMVAPVTPIYIALMYTVTNSVNAIRAINILLALLSIVLVYKLGKKMINKPVGLLAAGICAIHGQLIQYSATLLTEPLFLFLFIAGIYFLILALESNLLKNQSHFRYKSYVIASAVFLTMAIFTRSVVVLLPIFLLVTIGTFETYRKWRGITHSFPMLKRAILPLLLPILVIGIVATKNYVIFDRFMLTTGSGAALWLGSRADTEGDEPPYRGRSYDANLITQGASHISIQGDRLLMVAAKKNISKNPSAYAWWNVKKIGRLMVGSNLAWFYPYKNIEEWHHNNGRDGVATANLIFQIILATSIVVYGMIGLVAFRKQEPIVLIIGASVCYMVIFSVPFLAIQRYGLPLMTLLVVPASAVIYSTWQVAGWLRSVALFSMLLVITIVFQILFMG